jgi:hypothetical protein
MTDNMSWLFSIATTAPTTLEAILSLGGLVILGVALILYTTYKK